LSIAYKYIAFIAFIALIIDWIDLTLLTLKNPGYRLSNKKLPCLYIVDGKAESEGIKHNNIHYTCSRN